MDRVFYSSSVHDEHEIEAVVEVLRSGPQGLVAGPPRRRDGTSGRRPVRQKGRGDGEFGLLRALSGGRAAGPAAGQRGGHVRADVLDRHRTHRARRAGAGPRRLRARHVLRRRRTHRGDDHPAHRARCCFPNLIGNAPDWDAIREIADRHGLPTIEDSCDTLGPLLRGRPTGERSTMSVTSFANSHILTAAATAACCCWTTTRPATAR